MKPIYGRKIKPRSALATLAASIIVCAQLMSCAPIPHRELLATRITSRVVDDRGDPVAGAHVDYLFRGRRPLGHATTQSDGSFSLGPFYQWFYLIYVGSPGRVPFPYQLESPPMIPDALRISRDSATAIYLRGSPQDYESQVADIFARIVQLPRTARWTSKSRVLRLGSSMKDVELPKLHAHQPPLVPKIPE